MSVTRPARFAVAALLRRRRRLRSARRGALPQTEDPINARLALLGKSLTAVVRLALKDVDERGAAFNPRPYHRALTGLMMEMHAPDASLDSSHPQVLAAFATALLALQPLRIPGFAFSWLELVSHRCFLPRLLVDHNRRGWPLLQKLLTAVLKFLEPSLRGAELTETVRLLYRGTLRLLLVLLHDFPEFLCDHHFNLCDVIPPNCIQMRNLVLSAFPRNMRLPDPFTPNLKVDLLPEITQSPRVITGEADAAFRALAAQGGSGRLPQDPLVPQLCRHAARQAHPGRQGGRARGDGVQRAAAQRRRALRGRAGHRG